MINEFLSLTWFKLHCKRWLSKDVQTQLCRCVGCTCNRGWKELSLPLVSSSEGFVVCVWNFQQFVNPIMSSIAVKHNYSSFGFPKYISFLFSVKCASYATEYSVNFSSSYVFNMVACLTCERRSFYSLGRPYPVHVFHHRIGVFPLPLPLLVGHLLLCLHPSPTTPRELQKRFREKERWRN